MPDPTDVPVVVTVSSSSGTGGSGPVIPSGTPIILRVISPFVIVLVRAARVYLQTLVGLLTVGGVAPDAIPYSTFIELLTTSALLSIAPAAIAVIQNLIELLTRFDQTSPTLSV